MVFCAAEGYQPFTKESDIAFPHNVELKCNQDEWKGNLRGLKNRPGSTKPADITHLIRKKPANYPNTVEMVYALTTKVRPQFEVSLPLISARPISKSRIIMLNRQNLTNRSFTLWSIWFSKSPLTPWSPRYEEVA